MRKVEIELDIKLVTFGNRKDSRSSGCVKIQHSVGEG
jgi:hypothetical protein